VVPPAAALAFVTKMIQINKSTSSSAIQVKIDERQSVLKETNLKRVNKLLTYAVMLDSTYAVMLDSPILSYIQFVIMLIELRKVLNQELKCLCSKTTTVQSE
jgi:hypothetical protein